MKQKAVLPCMQPFLDGKVILINKPYEWTSFDAVKKVRIVTGVSKVGHAGTLDPLATGLLIICTGSFTKRITEYMNMEKEYTGTIYLGASTPTFDLESVPENFKSIEQLTENEILSATKNFTGEIMQVPPIYSAIKKNGNVAYQLARKGEEVILEPRKITIHEFEITEIKLPFISFKVVCSTGTYIRSLANDFGKYLQTGAYLNNLCRTRIGKFLNSDAVTPQHFEAEIKEIKAASERQANA